VLLNKTVISEINMGGRGGGEKKFAPALGSEWERISASLYDFVNIETDAKIELKKQKNQQWFDGWKYHNLSEEDKQIIMLFVVHDGQQVERVWSISLGEMVEILLNDEEYNESGWTAEILADEYRLKKIAPKRQSKLPIKVRNFVEKYRNRFKLHYQREP
jgi:hypothetical protein